MPGLPRVCSAICLNVTILSAPAGPAASRSARLTSAMSRACPASSAQVPPRPTVVGRIPASAVTAGSASMPAPTVLPVIRATAPKREPRVGWAAAESGRAALEALESGWKSAPARSLGLRIASVGGWARRRWARTAGVEGFKALPHACHAPKGGAREAAGVVRRCGPGCAVPGAISADRSMRAE